MTPACQLLKFDLLHFTFKTAAVLQVRHQTANRTVMTKPAHISACKDQSGRDQEDMFLQTATATGDYRYKAASNQMLFGQQQINMILAAINCSVTWVRSQGFTLPYIKAV